MRIEYGTAMLASLYANTHTQHGGYTVVDFMPHESERPVTLEEAMKSWG
ncbi:hypothetical protein NF676_17805 [Pseudomonas siliginis]|jgi:translation elongation factor EF-G|nr:hypothetical protein NF676_17805 [Pseudomonas siliginis]